MILHLRVWRQPGPDAPGRLVPYTVRDVSPDMSFLELLDVLNEDLVKRGEDPVAFDFDCREGATITVEPWRAKPFPVVKDLVVDRSAFDRIMAAGGFVSVNTGSAPEANTIPVPKDTAEAAMDAAACIGCGACVAACKNASAALFVGAKVTHLVLMPQGQPERARRVLAMVEQAEREGFGACSNEGECEAVCPKGISVAHIARLNREYLRALVARR